MFPYSIHSNTVKIKNALHDTNNQKKMRQCLMILNCEKYRHKAEVQKNTWLKEITIPWFHIIGNPNLTTQFEVDTTNHVLYVKCKDTYESLPMKTYSAICAIRQMFPDITHILKTDDDMKCNVENFNNVRSNISDCDYVGGFITCFEHISEYHYPNVEEHLRTPVLMKDTYYCPGRFYILSSKAIDVIINSKDWFASNMMEDYAVGYLLVSLTTGMKLGDINAHSVFSE
jgi:hypothetical protein